ncbi:hypothetical protein Q4Q39_13785 [Flavivirga amylovorans]|uniref:Uncharacterized protein n=1 Tax=Flavivirga amylovorans TaxID=870486 RepID=A0ABT8X4G3_9FLAO|nr:hypothetical protein [Flavivirga amylovorans]MDO5988479.1 hypothetical protein [Flavivirga amylovorans]
MSLLRLDGIYFMEYEDDSFNIITRLFRFYTKEFNLKSIFLPGRDINRQIILGLGKSLKLMDNEVTDSGIIISKYQLDENYQIKFTLGNEDFIGSLSLDHSYINITIDNTTNVTLKKIDLIEYIKLKELESFT